MIHLRSQRATYPLALEESKTEILCNCYAKNVVNLSELPISLQARAGTDCFPSRQLDTRALRMVSHVTSKINQLRGSRREDRSDVSN